MIERIKILEKRSDFTAISELIPYSGVIGMDCKLENHLIIAQLKNLKSNIGNYQLDILHGGVISALLEHAAMLQLIYEMNVKNLPKIINITVEFLRPGKAKNTFASAETIKLGQNIANMRSHAWQSNPDKIIAIAHSHFLLS